MNAYQMITTFTLGPDQAQIERAYPTGQVQMATAETRQTAGRQLQVGRTTWLNVDSEDASQGTLYGRIRTRPCRAGQFCGGPDTTVEVATCEVRQPGDDAFGPAFPSPEPIVEDSTRINCVGDSTNREGLQIFHDFVIGQTSRNVQYTTGLHDPVTGEKTVRSGNPNAGLERQNEDYVITGLGIYRPYILVDIDRNDPSRGVIHRQRTRPCHAGQYCGGSRGPEARCVVQGPSVEPAEPMPVYDTEVTCVHEASTAATIYRYEISLDTNQGLARFVQTREETATGDVFEGQERIGTFTERAGLVELGNPDLTIVRRTTGSSRGIIYGPRRPCHAGQYCSPPPRIATCAFR